MNPPVALNVLDFAPIAEGSTAAEAIGCTLDLAVHAEQFGYRRYWLGEHHLTQGSAGSAPFVLAAAVASRTDTIRVGTAAVVATVNDPVRVAEAVGTLDALYPARIDLGVARGHVGSVESAVPPVASPVSDRVENGLTFPSVRTPLESERRARYADQLHRSIQRCPESFDSETDALLRYLNLQPRSQVDDVEVQPAAGPGVEVWIHGTNPGATPKLAGRLGLPFGANYHFAGGGLLAAIADYRSAFRPGILPLPYVAVSVDVIVAATDAEAEALAEANRYRAWRNKTGVGVACLPSRQTIAAHQWTPRQLELTADRAAISLVGTADHVADLLRRLAALTGADEFAIVTTTFEHHERIESYRRLAKAWFG